MRILLLVFSFVTIAGNAQTASVMYCRDTTEYLKIFNDSCAILNIYSGGCLSSLRKGFGIVERRDSNILVKIKRSELVPTSRYDVISNSKSKGTIEFNVFNEDQTPISGANLVILDRKGRFVGGTIFKDKTLTINLRSDAYLIWVSLIGYTNLKIPVSQIENKLISITLVQGEVLEDNIVRFKILNTNSILLESWGYPEYKKSHLKIWLSKFRSDFIMIFTRWPWNYRWFHKCNNCGPEPIILIKK